VRKSRIFIVTGLAVALGLAFGGMASGVFRTAGTPSATPDIRSRAGELVPVATFPSETGSPDRQVVLQPTADGYLCIWDSPDGTAEHGVGGCNPASNPLGGRKLFVSLTYDGGPALSTVRDARLSGIAAPEVASARLVMTDGTTRTILLARPSTRAVAGTDYRSFAYRVRQADLVRGVSPAALLAYDGTGSVIDRQATGIG
jgi:hypothetical protein